MAAPSSQTISSRQSGPSASSRTSRTVWVAIVGAESWSAVRCSRYGAETFSGRAASSTDRLWPNFIAPPLSSPRVRNSCSAVRCWTSLSTASAGLPPSRLPTPSAWRPAYPRGSAARRAVRATALRGRSVMDPVSLTGGWVGWPNDFHLRQVEGEAGVRRPVGRADPRVHGGDPGRGGQPLLRVVAQRRRPAPVRPHRGVRGRRRRGARHQRPLPEGPGGPAAVRPGDAAGPQRPHGGRPLGHPRRVRDQGPS